MLANIEECVEQRVSLIGPESRAVDSEGSSKDAVSSHHLNGGETVQFPAPRLFTYLQTKREKVETVNGLYSYTKTWG